jgi:signal transduction histidine kinase/CheY-like chemotaxis protein
MPNSTTPIRQKLMTMILGTSGVVLLVTCAGFLSYEFLTFRQTAIRQLSTLGEIVAANSTAALAFDNQDDATEILAAVKAERHIVAAALYDRSGQLFSRYPAAAPGRGFQPTPGPDGYRFVGGYLVGYVPVVQVRGSQRLGTLYLRSDLGAMYERLRLYGGIALIVALTSSLAAYVLSRKLQQQISRPILALVETARAVSDRADYSVRARKLGEDELGLLTDAVNHMLERIQAQNLALQRAYDDLRQTQQAILQQERLRAVGQMASGIAHDINNAISPASLYVESLLEREPDLSARARNYLSLVQRAIEDVAQTVSRLREFYRQREPQLTLAPVNLNQVIEQVADLTRARWNDMSLQRGVVVDLRQELAPGLPAIMGVDGEIREALINLIFNAVDAMPEGGSITLRTRLEAGTPGSADPAAGPWVAVEVCDTGIGMDAETVRRCLEPFFTTKGERGTGLGLAMVYGTVQRHGARIEIESAVGRGTTLRLRFPLPAVAVVPVSETVELPPRAAPLRHRGVDADPALLESLRQALADDGHEVVAVGGGAAGIAAFRSALAAGRPFAAVFTDLGMPEVNGYRVAEAVKAASPSTPVFVLTGWGQGMAPEGEVPPPVERVLNKPPRLRDLREVLNSVAPPSP